MRASTIAQDPAGYLWITTKGGLYRFDGVRFDRSVSRLLPSQMTNGLRVDPDGSLWVGYAFGGLSHIRGREVITYREGLPPGTVFAFERTPDQVLWMASTGGVARFVGGHWQPVPDTMGLGPGSYEDMSTTADGRLWVKIDGKMWVLPVGATRFEPIEITEAFKQRYSLPAFATDRKLNLSTSPFIDSAGALWDFDAQGIRRFRPPFAGSAPGAGFTLERFGAAQGLSDPMVSAFFEDRDHNIWVSTALGVDQFRRTALTPVDFGVPVLNPTMATDLDGTTWMGTIYGGAFRITNGAVTAVPELGTFISCTTVDRQGVVWMGGKGGISRLEHGVISKLPVPDAVANAGTRLQAIATDRDGSLWVSWNSYGLFRWVNGTWHDVNTLGGASTRAVVRLVSDSSDRLWAAFADGRLAVKDAHGTTRVFGVPDGLDVGAAIGLAVNGDHVFAGGERGLAVLQGQRFQRVRAATQGAFDGISGIVIEPSGDVWLQSDAGIVKVLSTELTRALSAPGYDVKVTILDPSDGLVGMAEKLRPAPSLYQTPNGPLWVATSKGLAWIGPSVSLTRPPQPTPEITRVVADGVPVDFAGGLTLPPRTRILTIAFTAPTLSNPGHTHFRYRLRGFSDRWTDAGDRREATFTNLDPGSYTFHVQAIGADDGAAGEEMVIPFDLQSTWYQTWVFKAGVLASIVALLFIAYRFRISHLKAASRATYRERERIAREIHDTLLQSSQGLLLAAQSAIKQPMEAETRRELTKALELARIAAIEGRDRVSALREGQGLGECPLRQFLDDFPQRMASQEIRYIKIIEGEQRPTQPASGAELVAAIHEAIINAALHAQADVVQLTVKYGKRRLRVEISDNGTGMDVALARGLGKEGHWGIRGMKERVAGIGGNVEFASAPGQGTVVQITVMARELYLSH